MPPQLYNLGGLQKDANNKFGYTAAVTLELAQSLYETHKVLTYPRTSSRHLSTDMVAGFAGTLRAVSFPAAAPLVAAAIDRAENGPPLSKSYVDDSQLSDHHAMIPTRVQPRNLTEEERNIYELVAKRFLSIFLPDRMTEETRATFDVAGHKFAASGSRLIDAGWTAVYQGEIEADESTGKQEQEAIQQLPALKSGQEFETLSTTVKTKERKPPSRYTDATIIAAMETAGQDIEEDELRAIMKGKGLGTEATRASILKNLEVMEYIVRKKKFIEPTEKGTLLIQQVSEKVASAKLTADMEEKLEKIEQGQWSAAQLTSEIEMQLRADIPAVLSTAPITAPAISKAPQDGILCPKCKNGVVRHLGTRDFYSCSNYSNGCKFTINTDISGVKITPDYVKQICVKGRTALIKTFVSKKTGKPYSAFLVLDQDTFRISPEFEKRA
jgi:DNA topoisomerase-3